MLRGRGSGRDTAHSCEWQHGYTHRGVEHGDVRTERRRRPNAEGEEGVGERGVVVVHGREAAEAAAADGGARWAAGLRALWNDGLLLLRRLLPVLPAADGGELYGLPPIQQLRRIAPHALCRPVEATGDLRRRTTAEADAACTRLPMQPLRLPVPGRFVWQPDPRLARECLAHLGADARLLAHTPQECEYVRCTWKYNYGYKYGYKYMCKYK